MHRRTMPLHATTVVGFLLVAIVAPVAPLTAQTEANLTPSPDAAAAATDDAAVEREARDRIRSQRDLTGVAVAVDSGTATLTGEVATVQARSEAIRLVKERLESEGIELPEPIYRVRTEPLEPSRHRHEAVPERPRADLTEHGDPIVEQIDAERRAGDGDDLLDPSATRE